jgi:precorrin-6A/cobalt-precorrin-6A reductase
MHDPHNRQGHLWLLAGTGEGPGLAHALLRQGWRVSVSVVTPGAAAAYRQLPLSHVWVGPLADVAAIQHRLATQRIDRVVDATHPFATVISRQLVEACGASAGGLVRFERRLEPIISTAAAQLHMIDNVQLVRSERLLLALGSRHLSAVVAAFSPPPPQLFARVLPTPAGLRQARAAGIPPEQLALLRPLQSLAPAAASGALELALCRRWQITDVLCRQSGGASERCWHRVAEALGLRLWLLLRPAPPAGVSVVHSVEALLAALADPSCR